MKKTSLTNYQRTLLHLFSQHRDWVLKDFARHLGVSAAAITKAVDQLEHAGLVVRMKDTRDRRFILLHLTRVGEYFLSVNEEQADASATEVVPETRKHYREPEESGKKVDQHVSDPIVHISSEWYAWCRRWLDASQFTGEKIAGNYSDGLLTIGAWLARHHPDVSSPEQWTVELAEALVDALECLSSEEWTTLSQGRRSYRLLGKLKSDKSKTGLLAVATKFFTDCQQWGWIARHFDPEVDLRHRPFVASINQEVWDRLQWAARTLTVRDLIHLRTLHSFAYPLEMMRALAIALCFAGLRPNELCQLRLGAAWETWPIQGNSAHSLPASGNFFRQARYYLEVPLAQIKPIQGALSYFREVHPPVAQAILEWENVRPSQAAIYDAQVGEMVEWLFSYRGRRVNEDYIKRTVIPLLFYKAGFQQQDSHGIITTQRIRATVFRSCQKPE